MIPRLYRRVALGGAITVCAFVGFFLIFPVATVVSRGFSIDALSDSLGSGRIQHVIWFTTWQALISSLLTICVGLPIVIVLYRYRFVGRRLLLALTTIPFVLPTVVVAAAFVFIIGNTQQGLVAIIVAHVYFNLAVVVRIVGAHLRSVGSKFEDVAATLGAGPSHRFFTVTLKLAKRAIINAFVVVFLFCFTSYGVVKIIGGIKYTTIDVEIYNQAVRLGNLQMATALSVIQLL